jgi:hypothetical protein
MVSSCSFPNPPTDATTLADDTMPVTPDWFVTSKAVPETPVDPLLVYPPVVTDTIGSLNMLGDDDTIALVIALSVPALLYVKLFADSDVHLNTPFASAGVAPVT